MALRRGISQLAGPVREAPVDATDNHGLIQLCRVAGSAANLQRGLLSGLYCRPFEVAVARAQNLPTVRSGYMECEWGNFKIIIYIILAAQKVEIR